MTTHKRPLLIFGQGPVLDRILRKKAQDAKCPLGEEDMNFWGHSLALGGSILHHWGIPSKFIILGGRTGGVSPNGLQYHSEARIIQESLIAHHVPKMLTTLEEKSTNTLENIVNLMNLYLGEDSDQEFDLLGTNYHVARIKLLMDLFDIRYRYVFAAHELVKAREYGYGGKPWEGFATSDMLTRIERMLDLNSIMRTPLSEPDHQANRHFYEDLLGVERKNYYQRYAEEDVLTRMLLEVPEYWMKYLAQITSDRRLYRVLRIVNRLFPGYLRSLGVPWRSRTPEVMRITRRKLGEIPRPDIAQWIIDEAPKGWPQETRDKLEFIVEARRQLPA